MHRTMTSRQRYSSFNCRARGQTEYSLERNTLRSSSKASHSNNVCWIVSDSRDSQQGHCALRTSCIRQLELRRSWQPNRNFVFNLRPSRRDEGHVLSKYSGKPRDAAANLLNSISALKLPIPYATYVCVVGRLVQVPPGPVHYYECPRPSRRPV